MPIAKLLLVDDEPVLRATLSKILEHHDFEVVTAVNAADALRKINSGAFDVLLSDLHMPHAGDGLTVVSAMRHANPEAVTMLFNGFPAMDAAVDAILLQADIILVKPLAVEELIHTIKQRLLDGPTRARTVLSVATILEQNVATTITYWLGLVNRESNLIRVPLSDLLRTGHLPQMFRDIVLRLRSFRALGSKEFISEAAIQHGITRSRQGYSASMMVEESRILQVSIFQTLQNNLNSIDFSVLLIGVMTIADEVDSQLTQAMTSYIAQRPAP